MPSVSPLSSGLFRAQFSIYTIIFFFAVLILWQFGTLPLFDVDEGAFSEATREMLASGIYSATYLDGVPRYDKPILIYWFQAIAVYLFGVNEFAFRLPSVIFAALWLFIVGQFASEYLGKKRAHVAVLSLLGCVLFPLVARAAFADALLNLLLTLTLFDIYRYSQKLKSLYIYRVFLWMGLGMLTKGPVAIAIPLVVSGFYFPWQGQTKVMLRAFFHFRAWFIFILVLIPWLWMVYQQQGMAFFKGFLIDHNLARFTQTKEGHGGQWFYYFVVFPLITLPFGVILFRLIKTIKRQQKNAFSVFMTIWVLVILVIFSFSETQLPHYVMNACVPFILLFSKNLNSFRCLRGLLWIPIGLLAILILIPYVLPYVDIKAPFYVKEMLQPIGRIFGFGFYVFGLIVLILAIVLNFLPRIPTWTRLIWLSFLLSCFVYQGFLPRFAELQQGAVKRAGLLSKEAQVDVVRWRITMPSFSVYREAITPKMLPVAGQWVFTRAGQEQALADKIAPLQLTPRLAEGGIRLLTVTNPQVESKLLETKSGF